jgi:hypothetical protein
MYTIYDRTNRTQTGFSGHGPDFPDTDQNSRTRTGISGHRPDKPDTIVFETIGFECSEIPRMKQEATLHQNNNNNNKTQRVRCMGALTEQPQNNSKQSMNMFYMISTVVCEDRDIAINKTDSREKNNASH